MDKTDCEIYCQKMMNKKKKKMMNNISSSKERKDIPKESG